MTDDDVTERLPVVPHGTRTASGLQRRTLPASPASPVDPVTPTGTIHWPPGGIDERYHRPVMLTTRTVRVAPPGYVGPPRGWHWGHRHATGGHANTVVNRTCTHCVVEAELTYLHTMWAVEFDLPVGRRRWWWPGG